MTVVASRLHWNNHSDDAAIDVDAVVSQVRAFCSRALAYGDAIVLAIGIPSRDKTLLAASVHDLIEKLRLHLEAPVAASPKGRHVPVKIVALTHWGQFVPALNALIATAVTTCPAATRILFQSLEVDVGRSGVEHLHAHFVDGADLVVGAALPGHAFDPTCAQPMALTGLTTPWNTLALWDLRQLAKIGFPLVGDGLGLGDDNAGVEEVSAITLFQSLFLDASRAKVVQIPGLDWNTGSLDDPARRAWHERKMQSKLDRPARQLEHLALPSGRVHHIQ